MNFKLFYESKTKIGVYGWCEIKDITSPDMFGSDVVKTWSINRHYRDGSEANYVMTLDEHGQYEMYDNEGNDVIVFDPEEYIQAVKQWEIKHKLTPQTKETFGDLIDEL
jgi:hypothetical protein